MQSQRTQDGRIRLTAGAASCEICELGAHIVSWTVGGQEQIFLSSKATFVPGKAIRGGVPICWPQFGTNETAAGAPKQKHGFVRTAVWQLVDLQPDSATFAPPSDALAQWAPQGCEARYTVRLGATSLGMHLEVQAGAAPVEFTGCLHTYWRCEPEKTTVQGLAGAGADDGIGNTFRGDRTETRAEVPFVGETEQMYGRASDAVTIVEGGRPKLRLTKSNWPDWVLWNIGAEKAGSIADLGDGEVAHYVCVEPCAATSPQRVEPGQVWVGMHEAVVL